MKPYLLGIDIGTSACKVAVFNRNGEVLSQANGSYSVYYPNRAGQNKIQRSGGMQCAWR